MLSEYVDLNGLVAFTANGQWPYWDPLGDQSGNGNQAPAARRLDKA